jgi:hypothetical protein
MQASSFLAALPFFFAFALPASSTFATEITAGVARVDLTPPMELNASLGGYGDRMSRPAEGVHDRIMAKALVLKGGQRRFLLLTADMLGFPPTFKEALLKQIAEGGWKPEQLMLLPSHSHTSIEMNAIHSKNLLGNKQLGVFDEKLLKWTLDRCQAVIEEAASNLVPVTVGTSSTTIDGWNRNRRHRGGPTDPSLVVTRIDTIDGKSLAVLVHFTAHPTFMGAEHMLFGPDLQALLCDLLHDLGDQKVIGIGVNPFRSRLEIELALAQNHVEGLVDREVFVPFREISEGQIIAETADVVHHLANGDPMAVVGHLREKAVHVVVERELSLFGQ